MRSHTRPSNEPHRHRTTARLRRLVIPVAAGAAVAAVTACTSGSPASEGPDTVGRRPISAPMPAGPIPSDTASAALTARVPAPLTATVTSGLSPVVTTAAGTPFDGEHVSGPAAERLQQAVDAGRQPWRLDEDAVARAFVSARFGWSQATVTGNSESVRVATGPDGRGVTLALVQPARVGDGGIWVVESGHWN